MSLKERALAAISTAGARGATSDELERRLGASHQAVGPRLAELRQAGEIVASGQRRFTAAGREATVWVLSDGRAAPLSPNPKSDRTTARRTIGHRLGMIEELVGRLDALSYRDIFHARLGLLHVLVDLGYVEPLTLLSWLGEHGWKFGSPEKAQGGLFDNAMDTMLQVFGEKEFDLLVGRAKRKDKKGWWAGHLGFGEQEETK